MARRDPAYSVVEAVEAVGEERGILSPSSWAELPAVEQIPNLSLTAVRTFASVRDSLTVDMTKVLPLLMTAVEAGIEDIHLQLHTSSHRDHMLEGEHTRHVAGYSGSRPVERTRSLERSLAR